jgi:hypothetical protein
VAVPSSDLTDAEPTMTRERPGTLAHYPGSGDRRPSAKRTIFVTFRDPGPTFFGAT